MPSRASPRYRPSRDFCSNRATPRQTTEPPPNPLKRQAASQRQTRAHTAKHVSLPRNRHQAIICPHILLIHERLDDQGEHLGDYLTHVKQFLCFHPVGKLPSPVDLVLASCLPGFTPGGAVTQHDGSERILQITHVQQRRSGDYGSYVGMIGRASYWVLVFPTS